MSRSLPPKLLYLVTEDWYFVSHRLALAKAAREAGYDVCVATRVTRHGDVILQAGLRLLPVDFSRSGLHPLRELGLIKALVDLYRREQPDLVHHVAMKPVIYGSLAARLAGVRSVVNALTGLGYVFTSDERKARMMRPAVQRALKSALSGNKSRIILQNQDDASLLASAHLARAAYIRLIRGSGVDPAEFATVLPPDDPPLVLLPARLLRDKGVGEFVAAARMLKAKGIKARFVIAGEPDPLNPASFTAADVARWSADAVVECWGWREDIAAVLAHSSLVCLPSYREGLPKALLEAAAASRAIVATDVPGCREIVIPGRNGWLVPARDAPALAIALEEAIADPSRCARYGAVGRQMVEQLFSSRIIIRQTLDVYNELVPSDTILR